MTRILCVSLSSLDDNAADSLYRRASQFRREKADGFRLREDRLRCLAGEALLRYALGTGEFTLLRGEFGKPYIKERPDVHFNISHSGSWVVLAHADREVGIDIEQIRMDEKKEKLARRYFTEKEQTYVFRGDAAQMGQRFFQIWTAKESYLKYLGTGLTKQLQSFDVLSLNFPHFFTRTLDNHCLTLCTEDSNFHMERLSFEQL